MSATAQVKPKKIRAIVGLDKMPDGNVTPLLDASLKGLSAHTDIFSKLPVDLPTYGAGIANYEAAIPLALDGGKTAVAQKNKLKRAVVKMYSLNAKYVETNCNDDMATFLSSGFQPASTTKTPAQPLPTPVIKSLVLGATTGQLKLTIAPVPKAASYLIHYGVVPANGGTPATWTELTTASKKPLIFSNLTPGTIYSFQVKALGLAGYTDWSDAVSRMVV